MNNDDPYLIKTIFELCYNPRYGDDRVCKCGHPYYRHFDTYEDMYAIGCKYCGCFEFEEKQTKCDSTISPTQEESQSK